MKFFFIIQQAHLWSCTRCTERVSVYLNRRPNERANGRRRRRAFNFYQKRDFEHCYSGVHTPTDDGEREGLEREREGETKFNKRKNEKSWS